MSAPHMPTVTRKDIVNFTKHYWSEKRLMGVLAVVFMGISVGVDVLYPVMSGHLVDKVTELNPKDGGSLNQVLWAFAGLMAVQFSHTWFWTAAIWCWTKFAVNNMYRILTDALYKVQRFSTDWHVNAFAGATVRKITRGMWSFDVFEDTIFMGFIHLPLLRLV